jgi:hypothetical protein
VIEINTVLFVALVAFAVVGPTLAHFWGERRGFRSGGATMLLEMQRLGPGRIWDSKAAAAIGLRPPCPIPPKPVRASDAKIVTDGYTDLVREAARHLLRISPKVRPKVARELTIQANNWLTDAELYAFAVPSADPTVTVVLDPNLGLIEFVAALRAWDGSEPVPERFRREEDNDAE